MEFCLTVEPQNEFTRKVAEEVNIKVAKGEHTVPTFVSDECEYNVFMRVFKEEVMKASGASDPVTCMGVLRQWKTKGVRPSL